jgi:chemotaxis protein histidine kinase CheA
MAPKLSSRQQAQLAFLQQLPPKFQRIHSMIEQMGGARADEALARGLGRLLDEIKGKASALSLSGLSETAGIMGTMLRRGGGLQFRVRGLRELLGSLKSNYDGALRAATTPEDSGESEAPAKPIGDGAGPEASR